MRGSNVHISYAIVFVSDMKASISFYRDALGMPLRFETSHWSEFATEGATLALHLAEGSRQSENGATEAPGRCRPGLRVPDLDAFHQRMLTMNVPCAQPPRQTFGARIAQYVDPDGLTISVSEG
jgi:lactoylglutathione lyase